MTHPAITVENLSKAYRLGVRDEVPDTFAGALAGAVRSPLRNFKKLHRLTRFAKDDDAADTLWALKDVSFEVQQGEVLGVIGRNGAGKSTLLKILSRITEPTGGRAVIRGRVSSLLEVGTGFHPDLTGRENVYMNGTILGMRKREIDRKFDEIVAFSGIENFLDTPVKRYSSGMSVRLAFAVAAHLEPEILIIDEVLAVGDADFQKKCMGKMQNVAGSGRTVLFVSHNMGAVNRLCTRGLYLDDGSLKVNGTVKEAIKAYHRSNDGAASAPGHRYQPSNECQNESRTLKVNDVWVTSNGVMHSEGYSIGEPLEINVDLDVFQTLFHAAIVIRLRTSDSQLITELHSRRCDGHLSNFLPGRQIVSCAIPEIMLCAGDYQFQVSVAGNGRMVFNAETAGRITILPTDFFGTGKGPSVAGTIIICRQSWSKTSTVQAVDEVVERGLIASEPRDTEHGFESWHPI